jgi:hypothetical protein
MTGDVYRGGALPSVDVLKGLGLDKGNILERLKRRRNVDDYERWKKRDAYKNRDGPQDVLTANRCIIGQLMVDW